MKEYLTLRQLKHVRWSTIERLQNKRFKAVAHHMLPHVKAYKELFKHYNIDAQSINRVEDWKKFGLPLLKKAYYKEHPEDFVVQVPPSKAFRHYLGFLHEQESAAWLALLLKALTGKRRLEKEIKDYYFPKMPAFSGGTESGKPVPVFITAKQKQNMAKILEAAAELVFGQNKPHGHRIGMNLFPYAPHLGWHAVHMALDIAADLNLSTAAGGALSTEQLVEMADTFQANIFAGMSDYFRNRWLQVAQDKKITLPEKILFINGAQKMHEAERQKIADACRKLGAKETTALDFFGASEFKEDILPECAPGTGFHHIAPLSNIIRTVSAEARQKGSWITDWDFVPGAKGGYGVVWNTDGAGTLLEGYLVGDVYERIVQHPCPRCRLRCERIFGVSRIREAEAQLALTGTVEAKVKGSRINLAAIRDALLKLGEIAEAQVVARKSQLVLRIVPVATKQRAEMRALAALERLGLEVTPKIEWVSLSALTEKDGFKYKGIVIEQ
jgi:phenylacetate-coenzyme A ligase PaaK-like adenylate-forming protein